MTDRGDEKGADWVCVSGGTENSRQDCSVSPLSAGTRAKTPTGCLKP